MARAISVHAPVRYVLQEDEARSVDDPERTVFLLKPLSGAERLRLEQSVEGHVDRMYETLKLGLRGWERFLGEDRAAVAYSRIDDAPAQDQPYLAHLSADTLHELYLVILHGARLTKVDEGKSPTRSGSTSASSTSSAAPAPESAPAHADAGAAPTP